jgi:hypothetical protein
VIEGEDDRVHRIDLSGGTSSVAAAYARNLKKIAFIATVSKLWKLGRTV